MDKMKPSERIKIKSPIVKNEYAISFDELLKVLDEQAERIEILQESLIQACGKHPEFRESNCYYCVGETESKPKSMTFAEIEEVIDNAINATNLAPFSSQESVRALYGDDLFIKASALKQAFREKLGG